MSIYRHTYFYTMIHFRYLLTATLLAAACSVALADDSIPTTRLQELVVVGDNAWIEGDKAIFVPSKKEKKFANSPASLIKNMHIPLLREDQGKVTTLSGEAVTYFINGIRANAIDISTFMAKSAKRVEYIEEPKDPKFEGCRYVINIIMPEYEIGGVTSIQGRQNIPNDGNVYVSSKLQYKSMTYGAMVYGSYRRDHMMKSVGIDRYSDLFYKDEHYDEISNTTTQHSYSRSDNMSVTANARYHSKRLTATHALEYSWSENPWSGSTSADAWSPDLFKSKASESKSYARNISPGISGNYNYTLSPKWNISAYWSYSYGRNLSISNYCMEGLSPIDNQTRERVHSISGNITPSWQITKTLRINLRNNINVDHYDVNYTGNTNTAYTQLRTEIKSVANIGWFPSRKWMLSLTPGIQISQWDVAGVRDHAVRPTGQAMVRWSPNHKFSLSGFGFCFLSTPGASQSSPVTIQQSELMWVKGNPNLKGSEWWMSNLSAYWLATPWLRLSANVGLMYHVNEIVSIYTPNDRQMGGLLRYDMNIPDTQAISFSLPTYISLFKDALNISISPGLDYTRYTGKYATTLRTPHISGDIDYTIGNVQMHAFYSSARASLSMGGMEKVWNPASWAIGAKWALGDVQLSLDVHDLFKARTKAWRKGASGNYDWEHYTFSTGRCVSLSLSYIFGYGKEISRDIDIQRGEGVKSSIL